jgi:hypothetical protein
LLLAYTDYVTILAVSVQTVNENAEALVVASKEVGLEIKLITLITWIYFCIGRQDGRTGVILVIVQ